jgi:hypothetical protein
MALAGGGAGRARRPSCAAPRRPGRAQPCVAREAGARRGWGQGVMCVQGAPRGRHRSAQLRVLRCRCLGRHWWGRGQAVGRRGVRSGGGSSRPRQRAGGRPLHGLVHPLLLAVRRRRVRRLRRVAPAAAAAATAGRRAESVGRAGVVHGGAERVLLLRVVLLRVPRGELAVEGLLEVVLARGLGWGGWGVGRGGAREGQAGWRRCVLGGARGETWQAVGQNARRFGGLARWRAHARGRPPAAAARLAAAAAR